MKFFRLLAVLAFCASVSIAQTTTGRISGYVKDPSDSVIPDAQVTLLSEKTGLSRQTTSNQDGLFTFFSVPPANYTLTITAPGFASLTTKGLVLQLSQDLSQTYKLSLEGNQTAVNVEASAVDLDTSSATIGGNVAAREIQDLPINGRQISQLYLLVPGATNTGTGTLGDIRFSGRAVEQNIIRLDGIESASIIDTSPGNLNDELGSLFRLQQSLDSIQEFRVDSSSYPA